MINVINLRNVCDKESWILNKNHVYIGRETKELKGSKWGNPYIVEEEGSREKAVRKYEKYIKGNKSLLQCLPELKGKTLGCWCHPELCHGGILQRLSSNDQIYNMLSTTPLPESNSSPSTANEQRNEASPGVSNVEEDVTSRRTREYLEFFHRDLNLSDVVINRDHMTQNSNTQQQDPFSQMNAIQQHMADLHNRLNSVLGAYQGLNEQVKLMQERSDEKDKRLRALEKELNEHQQYNRRENIEIIGIPNTVGDDELEGKVINILNSIGCNISSYEIVACHRLKKSNTNESFNTIVRFTNRKICFYALQNRKALKWQYPSLPNLFIVENLCPRYKSIFDRCLELKREGKLKYVWSWNGTVHYKTVDDRNVRGTKVFHMSELEDKFGVNIQPQQQRGRRNDNG